MNKKWVYLLGILAIIFVAVFIRYPHTPNQRLFDSTHYHLETYLLIRDGRPIWNLSPLTIIGIYPIIGAGLMGSVYFLGSLSVMTGFTIENSIYMMNLGITIFMILSSFILGHKILNPKMGVLLAFFFSTTRIIVVYQDWTATPRGFFPGFLPIIIFLMFSVYNVLDKELKINKKYLLLFVIFLMGISTVHRALALAFPGLLLYFVYHRYQIKISECIKNIRNSLDISSLKYQMFKLFIISTVFFMAIVISIVFLSDFFGDPDFLRQTIIIRSNNPFLQSVNLLYYISRKYGIATIFAAFGFVSISIKSKNRYEVFLLLALLALIPFSVQEAYVFPIWGIYLSILSIYGFQELFQKIKIRKSIAIMISCLILITIVLAPFLVTISEPHHIERRSQTYVTDQEIETAYALRNFVDEDSSFYVNPRFNNFILSAYSKRCSLGLKGIEQVWMNESIKDEYIVKPIFEKNVGYTLENFYHEKGMLYYISNDPLIPERDAFRGWTAMGHYNIISYMYKGEWYHRIVENYNIRLFIIDNENALQQEYILDHNDNEYTIYNNGRYMFYPISVDI